VHEYNTNIEKLTCSCPDWEETRKQYLKNDPRRLCKHIINKLAIDNLPCTIGKFKESIEFYQKKEWGFKRDFDKIIELGNLTLLGNIDWIDIFDEDTIRYAVKKDYFSSTIYWANDIKPKNYEIIEKYLINESEKIPLRLEVEEHSQIVNFIKEVLPNKKDFYISIQNSQYIPSSDGIIYDVLESKLTPEQKDLLEQELLQEYPEDEVFVHLHKAASTDLNDEFCIYQALTVKNNEIIIGMDSGKKFKLKRNYQKIKQIKEQRELKERLEQHQNENKWKEELEKQRKIAQDIGCILSSDYKGNLYVHPSAVSREENEYMQKSIHRKYDTLQNLLKSAKKESIYISTNTFYKALKNLNFLIKEPLLNQNNWIIKGNGLDYGINLIKMSKYMHETVPEWYLVTMFDYQKKQLVNLKNTDIKMTNILYKKDEFNKLCQLVSLEIERMKKDVSHKIVAPNKKQLEREKWLHHVSCPSCGEETNIHKKDKRKRAAGYMIQRFYCNECNSMFQMNLDELEKLIQDYEKNEVKKNKSTDSNKIVEVQAVAKEETEPVKLSKSEEETNVFKKFFSFLK